MNMDKMLQESPESIGKLWTGYHMMRNKISAVIPARTYLQMIETAKKFPQFVLPLPRTTTNEEGVEEVGYEIQYMQWMFLPAPKTTSANAPPPAAVLFTPLAEYKLRQEYAQPSLVLSHYTDLIESKGLVLLRGEITESSPEDGSDAKPSLSQSDAQILTMCLQRFYHIDWALEGLDNDEQTEKRRALLRTFYEKPTDFKLESLVHLALST
ncbi:mitochondrial proton-transporting ATP synthase complex protein [Malassezia pachydermatis]